MHRLTGNVDDAAHVEVGVVAAAGCRHHAAGRRSCLPLYQRIQFFLLGNRQGRGSYRLLRIDSLTAAGQTYRNCPGQSRLSCRFAYAFVGFVFLVVISNGFTVYGQQLHGKIKVRQVVAEG